MGILRDIRRIYASAYAMYSRSQKAGDRAWQLEEDIPSFSLLPYQGAGGMLIRGDNRKIMERLIQDAAYKGQIQMIYIDPPFFSMTDRDAKLRTGSSYVRHPAYSDRWGRDMNAYLKALAVRLMLMKDLLREDGLIFVHLDYHAVHYARLLMDEIFGADRFVNEIIWHYKSGGAGKRRFSRKHDNILVYAKNKKYRFYPLEEKSYNRDLKPYRFKGVKEACDERGWYTMVNMRDVWDIDMVGRTAGERTGYATQKPEELLRRIIASATEKGDMVADFYAGSGTLGKVAAEMGRPFLMADIGSLAVATAKARLIRAGIPTKVYRMGKDREKKALTAVIKTAVTETASGKKELTVEVLGARIERDGYRDKKAEENLPYILSWSLDLDGGEVHKPAFVFLRRGKALSTSASWPLQEGKKGRGSLVMTDIFGDSVRKGFSYSVGDPAKKNSSSRLDGQEKM